MTTDQEEYWRTNAEYHKRSPGDEEANYHFFRKALACADLKCDCSILELGCGTGANLRALRGPVALDVQHLLGHQPIQTLFGRRQGLLAAGFDQGMAGQRGVPHRRNAGLAIGLVLADHQKLVEPLSRHGARRIIRALAEHLVHHHDIGHRRVNRA